MDRLNRDVIDKLKIQHSSIARSYSEIAMEILSPKVRTKTVKFADGENLEQTQTFYRGEKINQANSENKKVHTARKSAIKQSMKMNISLPQFEFSVIQEEIVTKYIKFESVLNFDSEYPFHVLNNRLEIQYQFDRFLDDSTDIAVKHMQDFNKHIFEDINKIIVSRAQKTTAEFSSDSDNWKILVILIKIVFN